jgi:hypothetical protein
MREVGLRIFMSEMKQEEVAARRQSTVVYVVNPGETSNSAKRVPRRRALHFGRERHEVLGGLSCVKGTVELGDCGPLLTTLIVLAGV